MSKIIITSIGVSGSGKSNAYGAIIELLKVRRRDNYYITSCGKTPAERLRNSGVINRYADISHGFISKGTLITTEFPFAFGGHFRPDIPTYPLLDLPLIDYPGGTLNTMLDQGSQASDQLLHRIMNTDVLLLFADANILSDPSLSIEQAREKIALEINTIFEILDTERDEVFLSKPRTVVLMLTKCDSNLIPDELRDNHFRGLINRALQVFDPTIRFCIDHPRWKIAVVPTSVCGDGNSVTQKTDGDQYISEMTASPQPYGFDIGILYGIMTELEHRVALGYDDSDAPPEEIEQKPGFVASFQWKHILQRLTTHEDEQIELYRRYVGNLHFVLDPLMGTQLFEI